jgi:hypothetical protein
VWCRDEGPLHVHFDIHDPTTGKSIARVAVVPRAAAETQVRLIAIAIAESIKWSWAESEPLRQRSAQSPQVEPVILQASELAAPRAHPSHLFVGPSAVWLTTGGLHLLGAGIDAAAGSADARPSVGVSVFAATGEVTAAPGAVRSDTASAALVARVRAGRGMVVGEIGVGARASLVRFAGLPTADNAAEWQGRTTLQPVFGPIVDVGLRLAIRRRASLRLRGEVGHTLAGVAARSAPGDERVSGFSGLWIVGSFGVDFAP